MVQVYGERGLNQPEQAAEAAEVVAAERREPQAYLTLTQYAALAGDDRQAELAGQRAVDLAPKAQRDQVERQVDAVLRAVGRLERGGAGASGSGE
jgi:hypothetical protein